MADRAYVSAAWVSADSVALSYDPGDGNMRLVVVSPRTGDERAVDIPPKDCQYRYLTTLTRLPTGELGLTDVCGTPGRESETTELRALDIERGTTRSLGRTDQPTFDISWRHDMTAVYSAGDDLCSTLYQRDEVDTPLDLEVTVSGQRFSIGQDLASSPERCPLGGRASHPAHSPDGQMLAFLASANAGARGQERLDLPWTLFVTDDEGPPMEVLRGIRHPGDVAWLADGRTLLFSGNVADRQGVWQVATDGSQLTVVAELHPAQMTLSPDGAELLAVVARAANQDTDRLAVVDLSE